VDIQISTFGFKFNLRRYIKELETKIWFAEDAAARAVAERQQLMETSKTSQKQASELERLGGELAKTQ
jgi:hypothetical protein